MVGGAYGADEVGMLRRRGKCVMRDEDGDGEGDGDGDGGDEQPAASRVASKQGRMSSMVAIKQSKSHTDGGFVMDDW